MAQAHPSQPECAEIARGERELEAQVGALLATVAATTGEIEAVAGEAMGVVPVEASLDEQVRVALVGPLPPAGFGAPVATDPPVEPASIGPGVEPAEPEIREIDLSLAAKVQAQLDEFCDPAQELAEPAALMLHVQMQDAPAADEVLPVDAAAQRERTPAAAPDVFASPAPAVGVAPVAPAPVPVSVAAGAKVPARVPAPVPAGVPGAVAARVAPEPAVAKVEVARGPSLARRVVESLEEAAEPLALRLGALPVILRQTLGWVGVLTLFNAGVVWVWVLFVAPRADISDVDPRSLLVAPVVKEANATGGEAKKDAAHGEKKGAAKDGHGAEKKAPVKKAEKKKDDEGKKKEARASGAEAKGGKKQASAGGH